MLWNKFAGKEFHQEDTLCKKCLQKMLYCYTMEILSHGQMHTS